MEKPQAAIACFIVALVTLSFEGDGATTEKQPTPGKFLTFMHKTVERKYLLYLPKDLPDNAPLGSWTVQVICQRRLQPTGRFQRRSVS